MSDQLDLPLRAAETVFMTSPPSTELSAISFDSMALILVAGNVCNADEGEVELVVVYGREDDVGLCVVVLVGKTPAVVAVVIVVVAGFLVLNAVVVVAVDDDDGGLGDDVLMGVVTAVVVAAELLEVGLA